MESIPDQSRLNGRVMAALVGAVRLFVPRHVTWRPPLVGPSTPTSIRTLAINVRGGGQPVHHPVSLHMQMSPLNMQIFPTAFLF